MAETKPKDSPSLRTPKAKKPLGLSVRLPLRMPHEELIKPETLPSQTSQSSETSQTLVAPAKDFARVPNSIAREVIPAGQFKGKSGQLYSALYRLTRGAIKPAKAVRISRPRLMKLAGIGSRVTFDANVSHLCRIGLLEVRSIAGEHDGNEYTVLTPEDRTMPSQTSQTSPAQFLDRLVCLETSQTRHTLSADLSTTSDESKTSFKTNTEKTDDEAFAGFVAALKAAGREVTGKDPSTSDSDKWVELAELLIVELKIAAGRTASVSNVPAFLTEHLRRRLWKKDKRQIEADAGESRNEQAPKVDASQCPDCFGTGMWYPEGFERGVAKCKHEKLTATG